MPTPGRWLALGTPQLALAAQSGTPRTCVLSALAIGRANAQRRFVLLHAPCKLLQRRQPPRPCLPSPALARLLRALHFGQKYGVDEVERCAGVH